MRREKPGRLMGPMEPEAFWACFCYSCFHGTLWRERREKEKPPALTGGFWASVRDALLLYVDPYIRIFMWHPGHEPNKRKGVWKAPLECLPVKPIHCNGKVEELAMAVCWNLMADEKLFDFLGLPNIDMVVESCTGESSARAF